MTFASTHKEALKAALTNWYSGLPNGLKSYPKLEKNMEAAILSYIEARGAKILPINAQAKMLQEICLVDGFSDQALAARYAAMLSAAPDSFTDEVSI